MFRNSLLALSLGIFLVTLGGATTPAGASSWLHVRVDEAGSGGEQVRLQVPLSLVAAVLPHLEAQAFDGDRVYLGDTDLDTEDLREILAEIEEAGDGEYVHVRDGESTVRVWKRGGELHVRVQEHGGWEPETVRVRLPIAVVHALLGGDPDELDLAAAVAALGGSGSTDLVSVEDGSTSVRVWVDERAGDLETFEGTFEDREDWKDWDGEDHGDEDSDVY